MDTPDRSVLKPTVVDFRSTAFPQSLHTLASHVSENKGTRFLLGKGKKGSDPFFLVDRLDE